ncbi:MAG: SEC-C domain-containing protein [Planctomycetes bacterium]|nr:SEC-C domain-containing protein [Planctomycetota bacterium]
MTGGLTPTEKFLTRLSQRSFLRLWSHPNVFRDQGNRGGGDGKEVVDLLAVFGRHVVLFSDKDCDYPIGPDPQVQWRRWYNRAITRSVNQLVGAQRWIENFPTRVFLDRSCTQRFPLDLAPADRRFHRIVVAHDRTGRRAAAIGGSGSLLIKPSVVGSAERFAVGVVGESMPFCHVWDERVVPLIMDHLDTAEDLVTYLERREEFFLSGKLGIAAGEEELLAWYLSRVDADYRHYFSVPEGVDKVVVGEGHWAAFVGSDTYRRYKEANQRSYLIDEIVDKFTDHAVAGTLYRDNGLHTLEELELGFRALASQGRVERRVLANALYGAVVEAGKIPLFFRVLQPSASRDAFYVFLVCRRLDSESYKDYRHRRGEILLAYVEWQAGKLIPVGSQVVGLAVDSEAHLGAEVSEDLMYVPRLEVSAKRMAAVTKVAKELGWGEKLRERSYSTEEYPSPMAIPRKGPGRNKPCPCGSGAKFKKCCGRI